MIVFETLRIYAVPILLHLNLDGSAEMDYERDTCVCDATYLKFVCFYGGFFGIA